MNCEWLSLHAAVIRCRIEKNVADDAPIEARDIGNFVATSGTKCVMDGVPRLGTVMTLYESTSGAVSMLSSYQTYRQTYRHIDGQTV